MKYSDWQLNRLRDALRAYKLYVRDSEGVYSTWKAVREAIAADTGFEIGISPEAGAERLRQFVEGANTKDGGRKYPAPKDDALDAIVQFALDEDNHLLSEDELKEYVPERQAPLRLLEYLDETTEAKRQVPIDKIQGVFQTRSQDIKHFIVRELTLQRPSEQGLVQVVETQDYYDPAFGSSYDTANPEERKSKWFCQAKHGGWAVVTPEDNLLFFMKNERNGNNRYYFTLATDIASWDDDPATQLFLMGHEFPLQNEEQYSEGTELASIVQGKAHENILTFLRHEPAQKQESPE